jgi:hypothetical protein
LVTCSAIVLSNHPQWFSSAFLLLFSSQLVVGLFRERIAKAYLLLPCHHLALLIWFGVCIPSESSSVNELSALPLTWRAYGAKASGVPYFCKLIPHAPDYSSRHWLSHSFRWINFSLFDAGNSNVLLFGALLFANDPTLRGPFKGEYHEGPALGCI